MVGSFKLNQEEANKLNIERIDNRLLTFYLDIQKLNEKIKRLEEIIDKIGASFD